jgi:virginiamycin B lyase
MNTPTGEDRVPRFMRRLRSRRESRYWRGSVLSAVVLTLLAALAATAWAVGVTNAGRSAKEPALASHVVRASVRHASASHVVAASVRHTSDRPKAQVHATTFKSTVLKGAAKPLTAVENTALKGTAKPLITSGEISEYSLPEESYPVGIAAGPDGNVWVAEVGSSKIGKITPSGTITEYALPEKSEPYDITAGPNEESALWFTDRGSGFVTHSGSSKIGKITTSGTITEYALPDKSGPNWITAGPDGNLWFIERESGKIGKITTSGTITEYSVPSVTGEGEGITAGPEKENALWFTVSGSTDQGAKKNLIGKITTSGTVTEYALPEGSDPTGITAGPDGNVWFTDWNTSKIGKITTSGTITEYSLTPGAGERRPIGIITGPNKNLWFADYGTHTIGEITTSGTITEYSEGSEVADSGSGWFGVLAFSQGSFWTGIGTPSKLAKITP